MQDVPRVQRVFIAVVRMRSDYIRYMGTFHILEADPGLDRILRTRSPAGDLTPCHNSVSPKPFAREAYIKGVFQVQDGIPSQHVIQYYPANGSTRSSVVRIADRRFSFCVIRSTQAAD